jgi:hypothetical protein
MTINITLDLETWGNRPGHDLRSIGACVFDPVTGWVGERAAPWASDQPTFYVATGNPELRRVEVGTATIIRRKYPLTRDPGTVQWWTEQSDEANAAFTDPVDLREALTGLTDWLDLVTRSARPIEHPSEMPIGIDGEMIDVQAHGVNHDQPLPLAKWPGLHLWAHGSHYDPPILAAAYEAVGLPVPWHYRAPRDTRTIFDAAGIEDHTAWLKQHPGPLGIPHHALDDAICQARAVCGAVARLRLPHDLMTHRDAWHGALEQLDQQERASEECYNVGFYEHERKVFVNVFDRLTDWPGGYD